MHTDNIAYCALVCLVISIARMMIVPNTILRAQELGQRCKVIPFVNMDTPLRALGVF